MGRGLGVAPPPLCRNITYIFSNKKNQQSGLKDMFFPIFFSKNKRGRIPYARILIVYKDVNAGR